jgi:hypothetical protein
MIAYIIYYLFGVLMSQKKPGRVRPARLSSLIRLSSLCRTQAVTSATTSPSPFNDEPNADTTFGQLSNAYDSTAMTRSLNIESSPFTQSGGSSYAHILQKALHAMMLTRHQELESLGINSFEKGKYHQTTAVRSPFTPSNIPESGKDEIATGAPGYNDIR